MRTTLTLEPDVAARLRERMKKEGKSFKETVNDLLRKGLDLELSEPPTSFKVEAYDFGFRAGTDLERMNQLVDSLEAEEFAKKLQS